MLSHIRIRDFAIIEQLEFDLSTGLTVITGETGAGKSIMIDAIGLVLGDRAEASQVRHGADKAEITLTIHLQDQDILNWLKAHDLDSDDECILRRIITAEGRSRGYINGSPTNLSTLRELGEHLVDIHGQHAHQSLLIPSAQRDLLDAHDKKIAPLLSKLKQQHQDWHSAKQAYEEVLSNSDERQARLDLLKFQVRELEDLSLQDGEIDHLGKEQQRLAHSDHLMQITQESLQALYEAENQTLYQQLNTVIGRIKEASEYDSAYQDTAEMLQQSCIQIEEAAANLRAINDQMEVDPSHLHAIDKRLGQAHDLARKHHVDPAELVSQLADMQTELDQLEGPTTSLEALQKELTETASQYDATAKLLRKKRLSAAKSLDKGISDALQQLGMEGGQFKTAVSSLADKERRSYGTEEIQFLVSGNPGQPAKPLSKVASGGELSRISLAIQLIAAEQIRRPTMIFDEVDSGVGGAVAEIVGQQLRSLGANCQVFCVTHLPQVAAFGHQHLQVLKTKTKSNTSTTLQKLDQHFRIEEVARMLGGKNITQKTRNHAEEMLATAIKE
jgi:DNA repair protein RecN (Recombination protein N)